ncbi:MAG: hypothetical protein M0022_07730 [Desulfobacteraceae bacterium]|nr:hypothetical protein [Desulfobacteraceae bacterium]
MQNAYSTTQVKAKDKAGIDVSSTSIEKEISKLTLAAGGIMAGAVGVWGLVCLAAGMISAGGPIELAKAWFSAVTGM